MTTHIFIVNDKSLLIKKGFITEKDLPIKVGERGKRYLINTDKKHQDYGQGNKIVIEEIKG
ncbi:MAG: hypothetical protein ACPLW7_06350 [Minisyncoccia bacterium]